jgi:cytochrome b6-f complex iron-sulfur subunit
VTTTRDRASLTRRRVIRDAGVGVLGITAVGTLVACGSEDDPETSPAPDATDGTAAPTTQPAPEPTDEATSGAPAEPPAEALAALDDIPVGGAIAATASDGAEIILARPADAEVVGFSAICTHQGCTVAPADEEIRCPCHGSAFDILTGENLSGPAPSPLESFAVRVEGDAVVEA